MDEGTPYQEILDAIEENSHGTDVFLGVDGKYCIVGYLLHKLGEADERLRNNSMLSREQYNTLISRYPFITYDRLVRLANTNDSSLTLTPRRAALKEMVTSWRTVDSIWGNSTSQENRWKRLL